MSLEEVTKKIREKFDGGVLSQKEFRGEQTLVIDREHLQEVLKYCRDEAEFDYLVDITTVDNSGSEPRFEIVYELYSYPQRHHLRIKSAAPEDDAEFASVSHIWPTANWHEREAWDMMGVRFSGHPDLRRILMWEGYPYFPLRKEFPLGGLPSDMPDVAFTDVAPLAGGPFVAGEGEGATSREPRARS